MNTNTKYAAAIGLLLLTAGTSRAQEWTFGPKVNLGLSVKPSVNFTRVNDLSISTVKGTFDDARTSGVGAFVRYDQTRWYGQFESNFLKSREINYSVNADIDLSNGTRQTFSLVTGGQSRYRVDARLLGGYKPLPWLRLYGGLGLARYAASPVSSFENSITAIEESSFPDNEFTQKSIETYKLAIALEERGVRRTNLEGIVGAGVDVGGLTVDLSLQQGLTPLIGSFSENGQTYNVNQRGQFLTLQLGYRLFPLKAHLSSPRKNRAYERIKQDIPFYRNEIHVVGGLLAEDFGSAFLYENRYTRYLSRRVGLTAGLNLMRVFDTYETGFLPKQFTQTQLITGLRFLPLYSRRHTIGLSVGPTLTYRSGFQVYSGGSQVVNGQTLRTVNLSGQSWLNEFRVSAHVTADYNVAATDRIIVGPWLRATPDNAYFGVQAGYRF